MASQDSQVFHWHYSEFDDRNFQIRGWTLFVILLLFSLIILITLSVLYARQFCNLCRPTAPHLFLRHSFLLFLGGSPPATIDNFPIRFHRSATNLSETECCICLGLFEDGEKVKVLPGCRHFYHSECVDKWLKAQSNCPLCRASLRVYSAV